ncbi:hypothetical protein NB620_10625 [Vibrio alginolyticus]|uniref:hypothetical protein n=1 Tax=Vibrio alginolyticus TaxID=663 RepID=UPI00215BAAA1|nr:hypothetical protein [Vibrio alginolyticus]MCS0000719.1 hypothetical protein [Vibrio alginolyticus]
MHITVTSSDKNLDSEHHTFEQPSLLLKNRIKSPEAQSKLKILRLSDSVLNCHCVSPPATMYLRKRGDYIFMVNHYEHGHHLQNCPLYSDIKGCREAVNRDISPESEESDFNTFIYHRALPSTGTDSTNPKSTSTRTPSVRHGESKLERLYYHLLTDTLSNWHFSGKSMSAEQHLFKLKSSANKILFGSSTLDKYIFIGPTGLRYAFSKLYRKTGAGWKGPGRPQAFCMFITNTIELKEHSLVIDDTCLSFTRLVSPLAKSALKEVEGPYFVLATLCQMHSERIKLHTVYIQPIVSLTNQVPITSSFERKVFTALISKIDNGSKRYSIQKILTTQMQRNTSDYSTPSFILQLKNNHGKVIYRSMVQIDDSIYNLDRFSRSPISLWRVNHSMTISPDEPVDIATEKIL